MSFAMRRQRVVRRGHMVMYLALLLGFCWLLIVPQGGLLAYVTSGAVTTLPLQGLAIPEAVAGFSTTRFDTDGAITLASQQVQAAAAGHLTISLEFPDGYHLNPRAPLTYTAQVSGTGLSIAESAHRFHAIAPSLPLSMAFQAASGEHQATVDIAMTFYYCRKDDTGVCAMQSVRWLVPLHTTASGATVQPVISYKAEAPVIDKQ